MNEYKKIKPFQEVEVSVVAQPVESWLVTLPSHVGSLVGVLVFVLQIQYPANMPWKTGDDGPSI